MISGIGSAFGGLPPREPTLIRAAEPKPPAIKAEEALRRQIIQQTLPEKSAVLTPPEASTRAIQRYGEAPSPLERSVDTGITNVGLRNPVVRAEPEPTPEIVEKRGGRHVDRLEMSPAERQRQLAILARTRNDASEFTPSDTMKDIHTRPDDLLKRDLHPDSYEAYRRSTQEPKPGTMLNETA